MATRTQGDGLLGLLSAHIVIGTLRGVGGRGTSVNRPY